MLGRVSDAIAITSLDLSKWAALPRDAAAIPRAGRRSAPHVPDAWLRCAAAGRARNGLAAAQGGEEAPCVCGAATLLKGRW